MGGLRPGYLARPASTAELAEVMAAACHDDAAVVVRGGGTRLGWGGPPSRLDLLVDTGGLARVVEYTPDDLVVVVEAGLTLGELDSVLAEHGQRLALDPPWPGATVGGVIATNAAGPLRLGYGGVRDLLIGVTLVRADGAVAHAGGKVVKNVAGYDLGRLLVGSYGTLGVIAQAALRLHPRPESVAYACAPVEEPARLAGCVLELLRSQLDPVALELDQPVAGGPGWVGVQLEGAAAGARAQRVRELLGAGAEVSPTPPPWWGRPPFGPGEVGLLLLFPPASLVAVLAELEAAGRAWGCQVALNGSVGSGVLLGGGAAGDDLAGFLAQARPALARHGARVVVAQAPPEVAGAVDLWGEVPGLGLMRRVKDQFDPGHLLAPGRFVGGI